MFNKIKEFFRVLGELRYLIPVMRYKFPDPEDQASLAHTFQATTDKFSERPFLHFENEMWTYGHTNTAANSLARYLVSTGVKHGDRVVMFMENRPSFVISLLALNKIGAIGVLINTSLTGDPLVHCINSSDSVKCIVGAERVDALEDVLDQINITKQEDFLWAEDTAEFSLPDWAIDLKAQLDLSNDQNLEETNSVKAKDVACYIFTSGTTGVPKAAICPNQKLMAASINIKMAGYRIDETDCMHNSLPLYHSTGLMLGLCAVIQAGASTFIKRKFSASSFWDEVQQYNTTALVYIGELCRYLANTEPTQAEQNNPLKVMVGNGLRPDVWDIFKDRFAEYFKFCFVRNPYDRLYSSYKFLERGGVNIHDANAFQKHLIRYKDFEDFVLHGLSYNLLDEIIHFIPQTIFICDQKDVILVDFIGRFESLEEDFLKLADKLSLDIALPHLNSTNKISYRDIYTEDMMIKVKEIYKRDFDILGY